MLALTKLDQKFKTVLSKIGFITDFEKINYPVPALQLERYITIGAVIVVNLFFYFLIHNEYKRKVYFTAYKNLAVFSLSFQKKTKFPLLD